MAKSAIASLTPEASNDRINTGLKADYRKSMSKDLSEIHYNELFGATDVIAERIRALGHLAPVSLDMAKSFAPTASDVDQASAHDMVADLIKDHEQTVRDMRKAAGDAGENEDNVTEDMLTARLNFHEKALWMLRSVVAN